MGKVADRVAKCLEYVRKRTDFIPRVALILGSGLGDFAVLYLDMLRIPRLSLCRDVSIIMKDIQWRMWYYRFA